ncbi:DNA repair protein RecN [Levilactobacillus bambusae]|uniref:DNA repair protein RecN n=1 Tax=Levilactobacillus bambusae TaxID=2024736 RepID=A0A2V1N4Y4_9LACO|nr:DNA repair protein RecN [Levilactobacillus bambusae]PWG00925.1 DNA repair protein RecN [Levilactobacillus bambusae]
MLEELSIRNFAIIDHLDVEFSKGMTVLTGETGAGKSIIIDAVGLLAGGRGSVHFIRTGADKAVIQGSFSFPKHGVTYRVLDELGIDHEDGTVILQREIYKSGRNVCRVNGMLVNTTTLKRIGETAVDIHGQNEHQELMQPEKHLGMLDEFADGKVAELRTTYEELYQNYQHLDHLVREKHDNEQEWAQRLDMLRFQVKEIGEADLKSGEEESLTTERDRLDNFQKINDSLQESYLALAGEDTPGAVDIVGQAMSSLQSIADFDPAFRELSNSVEAAYYGLQDAEGDISNQIDLLEWDDERLNDIEKRLELISELKRKYGDTEAEILDYYHKIQVELAGMEESNSTDEDLDAELTTAKSKALTVARQLSQERQSAAKRLETDIHHQLADLYMAKTVFEVRFNPNHQKLTATGIDDVEFWLQTNPGEEMRPLAKTASGGELSRIMLALKTIFSHAQGVTSIIFDEVDTGVSGRVAQAIAEKISDIAAGSQVLVITHLPQVAAMADHHYFIAKTIVGKRTETSLTRLEMADRPAEIARMSAGTQVTKLALEHAQELLDMAEQVKQKQGQST